MATLVTGGLRKVIADAHKAGRSRVGVTKAISDVVEIPNLKTVIDAAEIEAHYNPSLDRDEFVYQAVIKAQRDNEPSDWVLPDPDAKWDTHLPYENSNFRL